MRDRMSVNVSPQYGQGGSISYTGTAGNSGNIHTGVSGVFVTCSTDAWARFAAVNNGTAPTAVAGTGATGGDMFCPQGATVFLPNDDATGQPMQLSVVRDATSGTARFTPAT